MTLGEMAEKIGAILVHTPNPAITITGVSGLDSAHPSHISFLSNPKYLPEAKNTRAGAVIVQKEMADLTCPQLVVDNPYLAWAKAVALFAPDRSPFLSAGIHPTAVVHSSALLHPSVQVGARAVIGSGTIIGENCRIHPGVVIEENCRIGSHCEIHPNTVLHYNCTLGNRVTVWSGTVIGSYGFGYAQEGDTFIRIHQLGTVLIEDDVDIGANVTIDRGATGPTRIRRGTKIDNLVHLAHNVQVGEDCAITAQVGVSGSTHIGNRVKIGGQAGFVGHINIGDDSFVGAKAGVSKSFPEKSNITGYPARPFMETRRSEAMVAKLPDILKRLDALEKQTPSSQPQ
ncbi:MAG: UDP-3-O-(3-hydroxymyristoyl)glucosamine N-acyltransferase [Elusimicrobia bacterium RIFOXYB2_FULL_49_7]|nr:MAG: UDP-3-O-(3-hydroxymyristoyl)glucosamine N-acyltransferase [Elusimicrobia bacterium RIFOXYB2_FULL_49_7]